MSFLLGMLVPLACAEGIRAPRSLVLNRFFLATALFELFFFLPLGAYLFYFYPAWSLEFFLDPATLEENTVRTLGMAALGGYMAAALGGFILAAWLVRSERESTARLVFLAVALVLAAFSAATYRQLAGVGAYTDWIASPRTTVPLYLHRIGVIIALDAAAAAVVLFLMLRTLRREDSAIAE